LITDNPNAVDKSIKKIYAYRKARKTIKGYLHASNDLDENVSRVLRYINKNDLSIATLIINKKIFAKTAKIHKLYKNLVFEFIQKLFDDGVLNRGEKYSFVASRYFNNKKLDEEFTNYLMENVENMNITTEPAHSDRKLMAVDYCAWAFYCKYEHGDGMFYEIINQKIAKEYYIEGKTHGRLYGPTTSGPGRGIYLLCDQFSKRDSKSQEGKYALDDRSKKQQR
jgi:hypothetical protein